MDTSALTRADGNNTVVNRGRYVLGDPVNPTSFAAVTPTGEVAVITRLRNIEAQLARVARLLEILADTEVPLGSA